MDGYGFALFLHVCGALVLFAAIALELVGGSQILGAREVTPIRLWSGALAINGRLFPIATVVLLATGLFMTFDAWEITTPWVLTSLIALVVFLMTTKPGWLGSIVVLVVAALLGAVAVMTVAARRASAGAPTQVA